jgi:glycogen operon protein
MTRQDWNRADAHAVAVHLNGDAIGERDTQGRPVRDDSFLVLINSHWEHVVFTLPGPAFGGRWRIEVDTAADQVADPAPAAGMASHLPSRVPEGLAAEGPVAGAGAGAAAVFGPGEKVKAEARSLVLLIREDGIHHEAAGRREAGGSRAGGGLRAGGAS